MQLLKQKMKEQRPEQQADFHVVGVSYQSLLEVQCKEAYDHQLTDLYPACC
jgi:hypothetical protein